MKTYVECIPCFDRLLIGQRPGADVYYAVKGSPVIGRGLGEPVGNWVAREHKGLGK